jgi:hypothetical protein
MPHKTIDDVRYLLKVWGIFQATQELGSGYSSISTTSRICEMLKTQIWASSDLHLFSHLSDNLHEPEHISQVTEALNKLTLNYRRSIITKYKTSLSKTKPRKEDLDNYFTREAENYLLGLL